MRSAILRRNFTGISDVCTVNEVFDHQTSDFLYIRDGNLLYRHGQGHHHTTPGHMSAEDH